MKLFEAVIAEALQEKIEGFEDPYFDKYRAEIRAKRNFYRGISGKYNPKYVGDPNDSESGFEFLTENPNLAIEYIEQGGAEGNDIPGGTLLTYSMSLKDPKLFINSQFGENDFYIERGTKRPSEINYFEDRGDAIKVKKPKPTGKDKALFNRIFSERGQDILQ